MLHRKKRTREGMISFHSPLLSVSSISELFKKRNQTSISVSMQSQLRMALNGVLKKKVKRQPQRKSGCKAITCRFPIRRNKTMQTGQGGNMFRHKLLTTMSWSLFSERYHEEKQFRAETFKLGRDTNVCFSFSYVFVSDTTRFLLF